MKNKKRIGQKKRGKEFFMRIGKLGGKKTARRRTRR